MLLNLTAHLKQHQLAFKLCLVIIIVLCKFEEAVRYFEEAILYLKRLVWYFEHGGVVLSRGDVVL